jgi:hypothetical protein
VDLSRRERLSLGTDPELLKQLGTIRRQAVVPLEAACRRRGAELVDQPMVVKQAQPAPGGAEESPLHPSSVSWLEER